MKRIVTLLWLVVIGCSPVQPPPTPPEGPHFLWSADEQSLDNPFPDARLTVDGVTTLRADWYRPFLMKATLTAKMRAFFQGYADVAHTDVAGFGNLGPTLLRTSEPIDRTTLPGRFHRLRKVGEGYEVLEPDVAYEHVLDALTDTGVTAPADYPEFTMVRPGEVLREGEDGLLVVTSGVKTAGGVALTRGAAFEASKPALTAAATALGIDESDILLALPQRGAPTTAQFVGLAQWVETAAGAPAVTIPPRAIVDELLVGTWVASDASFSSMKPFVEQVGFSRPATDIDRVVVGSIASRELRQSGRWKSEWVANPASAPVVPLQFVLTVPKGQKPAGGWKVVIGAHGIGGRNTPHGSESAFCPELGEYFARAGFACLGIDAPNHGTRGNVVGFFDVQNMTVTRDEFRQMVFDLMQLRRAAGSIDVDGDGQGDLQSDVSFFGNSLGAIMGSAYVPFDSHVKTAVLNVPGGGLSNILAGQAMRDRIGLLIVSQTDLSFGTAEYYSAFPLFRAIAQPLLEQGDPINAAGSQPADRAVLQQMGQGDNTIPNFTSLNLRDAFALSEPMANVDGSTPLHVFFRVDPVAAHATDPEGHNVFWNIALLRDQAIGFLSSGGTRLQVVP